MGSYKQYITNAGNNMITQALSGGELEFTRVVLSSAEIVGTEEEIIELTELSDVKKTTIPAAAAVSGNAIRVQSSFTNEDVTESYLVQSVGLYARIKDNQEALFDIAVAEDPSKMTVQSTQSVDTLKFNFNIAVQQAERITITVAPGGSLPSEVFYQMFPGMTAPNEEKAGNVLMVSEAGKWEYAKIDDKLSETSENLVKNKVIAAELNKQRKKLEDMFPDLPVPTSDDAGKTVKINSEGKAVWSQTDDIRDQIENFRAKHTDFNADGSITETDASGNTKHTVFNDDGSITETLTDSGGNVIATKTTTFNDDGSIDEEVV